MTAACSSVPLEGGGLARGEYVVGIAPVAGRVVVVSLAVQGLPADRAAGPGPEKDGLVT